MIDPKEIAEQLLGAVKEYVAKAIAPIVDRLEKGDQNITALKEAITDSASEIQSHLEEKVSDGLKVATDTLDTSREEMAAELRETIAAMSARLDEKVQELNAIEIKPGKDGKDGENGRDALIIDVLPSIDESRSYAPRTYASHKGGMWVSRKQTRGMEGWECIVKGVSAVSIEQIDDRNFTISSEFSDGVKEEKSFTMPVMIYKGVYADGSEYAKDDVVTWSGACWIAKQENPGRPGEINDAWKLVVKKGRDGRDGKAGVPGQKGDTGKTGGYNENIHLSGGRT